MNELAHFSGADAGLRELALFAGAGGGILGGHLLGWRTVCAVEIEPYPASVLAQRQNDGILPPFPIWDDICTFDGRPLRGIIDVVSGGFPCQDISTAGRGAGIGGEKSGLWKQMRRVIGEVEPIFAYMENSGALVSRGLGTVLGDLAAMGFDAEWGIVPASAFGAPHDRERIWIVATHPDRAQRKGRELSGRAYQEHPDVSRLSWWQDSSRIQRVDDGIPARVDRLKAIGNGQVPIVAATAWRILGGD